MWELDYKESWAPKNWCFWTAVLEKPLESPLDCKEIQPVHPKGVQSWVIIGSSDVEAETPVLWPLDAKSWLIWKDPDAGKDWGQEEKGMTEDEMVGWHHRLDGHGFGWTPGVYDGQGGLACCSSWVAKSQTQLSDWTELRHLSAYWKPVWDTEVVIPHTCFSTRLGLQRVHAWTWDFPGYASGKEPIWQCRRHKRWGFSPWVEKISWRRAGLYTPLFLRGECHGQRSPAGYSP